MLSVFLPSLLSAVFTSPPSTSAGVVERQIEKEYEAEEIPPQKEIPLFEVDIPKEQFDIGGRQAISITSVEFLGNTVYSAEKLSGIADNYVGKNVTMKEIRQLCLDIQNLYIKDGYFLAQLFPPAQKVVDGQLKIQIIEGVLGEVKVVGNTAYTASFIASYFTRFQGKPINYDDFLKAVLLANENRELTLGVVFEKGSKPGTADVILRVKDKYPIHLYVDYNNYGSHDISLSRTGLRLDYGNLFAQGDNLTAVEVAGIPFSRLQFTDLIYSVPINRRGTIFQTSYLYSNFKVQRNKPLHQAGRSQIGEIKFTHPVIAKRNWMTHLYAAFDLKWIKNFIFGHTSSYDNLRVLIGGADFDYYTDKGRSLGDFRINWGIPSFLGSSPVDNPKASRQGSGGRFVYVSALLKHIHPFSKDRYLLFNFTGQTSFNKLPLSEQFYIGGIDTVRGYPLATALGDHGLCANLEFRFPPPVIANKEVPLLKKKVNELVQLVLFVDNGEVFFIGGSAPHENGFISLTSAGFGFRINGPWRFDFSLDAGFPLTKRHRGAGAIWYFKVSLSPF